MKGVGEAAIENIIEEREKHGRFTSIYDFIKRVNQRTVNKKSWRALLMQALLIALRIFTGHSIFLRPREKQSTGLEKIIRFGNQYQAQLTSNYQYTCLETCKCRKLFRHQIPDCEPWPLIQIA